MRIKPPDDTMIAFSGNRCDESEVDGGLICPFLGWWEDTDCGRCGLFNESLQQRKDSYYSRCDECKEYEEKLDKQGDKI